MAKKARKPPRQRLSARQRAQDRNPLYDPAAQLAGHRLAAAADAIVGAEFTPKLAALGREARSTEAQGTALASRAGGYYSTLATRSGDTQAKLAAIRDQLRAGLADVASQSGAAADAAKTDVMSRLAADVANRGTGLEGGGDRAVLDELAAQRARMADTALAYRSWGEAQSANAATLGAEQAAATQQRGGEVQAQLLNRLANAMTDIRGKRSDLEAQRGDERVAQLVKLRQQGYENLVTARGLNIKQSQLAADVANQQTQADLAARRIASTERTNRSRVRAQQRGQDLSSETTQRGQDLSHADRLAAIEQRRQAAANKKAASKGKEPAAAVKTKRAVQNTLTALQQGHSLRWLQKQGAEPDVLQAAQDINTYGHLAPDTYNNLLRLGMDVPNEWRPPRVNRRQYGPH